MSLLSVYVPAPASDLRLVLERGCAIVGGRRSGGNGQLVVIDLEDNRYQPPKPADDMAVYLDCLARAAGRHVARYPTVARLAVDPASLTVVGTWDPDAQVLSIDDAAPLAEWRGAPPEVVAPGPEAE
jgi:hypothetical protein